MCIDLNETWGLVYVNGTLMPAGEASVSALDRGLLYGDGLFETIRVYNGMPFMLDAHIRRMGDGCAVIEFPPPDPDEIRRAARQVLEANDLTGDAYLRVTVTRGPTGRMWTDLGGSQPTLIAVAKPYSPPDHGNGLRLTVSQSFRSDERSPLSRIKQTGILWKIMPRVQAQRAGFDDALLLNTSADISEGTSANIFWTKDGALHTPALECGILPGITRSLVIQVAREHNIAVTEGCFPIEHLLSADEAFLTSSTAELVPVRSIGDTEFPGGPITGLLTRLYRQRIRVSQTCP